MKNKEKIQKNIEKLKNDILTEKKNHEEKMKNIEIEKNKELEKIKAKNEDELKKLDDMSKKMFSDLDVELKKIEDTGEKEKEELKNQQKNKLEEDKKKLQNEKKLKKQKTKSNVINEPNLESEINKEKNEIQKLINENQKLLGDARQKQNEINFYEMNFGQLFFSDEIRNEIQNQTNVFKNEYENLLKEKLQLFAQYKSDPQLNKFLQLAPSNQIMYSYLIPQIYYEFSGQM